MSYSELVDSIAVQTGTPRTVVRVVLKAFTEEVWTVLHTKERIAIPGFGVFTDKDIKPRMVFGKMSEARRSIRFKASRRGRDGEAGSGTGRGESEAGGEDGEAAVPEVRNGAPISKP